MLAIGNTDAQALQVAAADARRGDPLDACRALRKIGFRRSGTGWSPPERGRGVCWGQNGIKYAPLSWEFRAPKALCLAFFASSAAQQLVNACICNAAQAEHVLHREACTNTRRRTIALHHGLVVGASIHKMLYPSSGER